MAKKNKPDKTTIDHLLNIDNVYFYFDIESLGDFVKVEPKKTTKMLVEGTIDDDDDDHIIDISKYEMIKMMIDIVLTYGGDISGAHMDMDNIEKIIKNTSDFDNMPLAFKLAFNTLLINKILVKYESN